MGVDTRRRASEADPARVREAFSYDPESGVITWKTNVRPRYRPPHGTAAFVSKNANGYLFGLFEGERYKAHRIAWVLYYGRWPEGHIDHINGLRADNRIANLRDIDPAENARNAKVSRTSRLGVRGVTARRGKYLAYGYHGEQQITLGTFQTLEAAHAARKAFEVSRGFHPNHGRRS